ncbi:MAG TPA: molybdopterin molybdenumtransferase MoeA, partial [Polyangia bacterium]|nr:molybdopterin molybdenumtransferase MoeA [Polyangia bacterium]
MLWRLGGEVDRDPWPARRRARLGTAHKSVVGREDYLRVRLATRDGELWADPLPGGSATLSNLVRADALVRVEADRADVAAGDPVEALVYL